MDTLDEEADVNINDEDALCDRPAVSSSRYVPRNDARGRVHAITPEEQARNAKAIAELVDRMLTMPDDHPPGAWEEAMRDIDAHRPHRKRFEGLY
jgi:hypothetical protein